MATRVVQVGSRQQAAGSSASDALLEAGAAGSIERMLRCNRPARRRRGAACGLFPLLVAARVVLASVVCRAYNNLMASATARHHQRATREAGQKTRTKLLDAAAALFSARGPDVAVTEIATAADCFPSQVTYYFGSKEALLVEAACRELLHLGRAAEDAAAASGDATAYVRALVAVVAPAPALSLIIEAMAIARRRPELAGGVADAFDRLHREGARAFAAEQARRGWAASDAVASSKRFWTLALGIRLRVAGTGGNPADCVGERLAILAHELAPGGKR